MNIINLILVWKNKLEIKQKNIHKINSLIGRELVWKGEKYKIIDVHNKTDFVLLDDDNMSMVHLDWDNVKLIENNT